MAETHDVASTSNRLLSKLSADDFDLLRPSLSHIDLPLRMQLARRNQPIEHVYFIERGIASVVANGNGQRSIEVGIIGWEGLTGIAILMGTDRSPHETYMQIAGSGLRIGQADFLRAIGQSSTLQRWLLNYAHAFFVQTSYTALANGRGKLEERLARWLLMAHDRCEGDDLHLTHEFLGIMLGTRRPGVTIALSQLEKSGLIRTERAAVIVMDREGLEDVADGAYGPAEAELKRLFG
jgi:CRP-like cAMP-binding protein